MAEKTSKKSQKFGFTEITLSLAKLLRKHYAEINPKKNKYDFYLKLIQEAKDTLEAEDLAEQLYSDLVFNFTKSKSYSNELTIKGESYINQLRPLLDKYDSFRLHYTANNILVTIYQLKSDHRKVIDTCNSALNFFIQLPYAQKAAIFSFSYKSIPAYIQLGEFENASTSINKCLGLVKKGSHNWVITNQYKVMLGFYSGNFELSYHTVLEVKKQIKNYQHLKELWLIYEAYTQFLIGETLNGKSFRLAKFLNDVPTFSNDKRGMNINILVIQILFLLKRGKKGKIIDRSEALERYSYRHLKMDNTIRSNCFIKMLLLIPACQFNKISLERKSRTLLVKLKATPINLAKQDHDLEVVPYEKLWEIVLSMLKG